MLLLVVHGLAGVIWMPASQVLIHQIVTPEQLPSAVRLNATGRYLGFLVGPGGRCRASVGVRTRLRHSGQCADLRAICSSG